MNAGKGTGVTVYADASHWPLERMIMGHMITDTTMAELWTDSGRLVAPRCTTYWIWGVFTLCANMI